ncbi:MAG: D-alanyl-D-alanine carboxypeptidase [Lachnospiraceae bacterium]|nr:D-alanyl-D-alanine carboxypeptidase [Lachnospiraceae bacterium]
MMCSYTVTSDVMVYGMSFFYRLKYRIKEAYLLWLFPIFLIISCVFINIPSIDKCNDKDVLGHLFVVDEKANKKVMETMSEIDMLYAKYALLMDADNGRVLYEKDGYTKVPMASTTKIMTLLIALENGNPDDVVTVSDYAASMPDVQLNIKANEQYRLIDLLYSLMLESHNDSAVAIAEHIGGSVEGFAALMNNKAKELGAYNTHFVTPNGLDDENHYTTAYDLALIASYAIRNLQFCNIVATPSYQFHEQSTGRTFSLNNKDRFLTSYPGAIGIKTGFTGNAGYCFVGAINRDDKRLVSVVLASGWPPHKTYKWKDTAKLMDYGVINYSRKNVLASGDRLGEVIVSDSIEGGTVGAYTDEDVALLLNDNESVHYDIMLPDVLKAPVNVGDTIGNVVIYIDGMQYKIVPLYAKEKKTLITYGYVLGKVVKEYFHAD